MSWSYAMSEHETATAEEEVVEEQDAEAAEGEVVEAPTLEEFEALQSRLAETEKALAEADLRAQAEVQNMRRRVERDVANARKLVLEQFSIGIISVEDAVERGLADLAEDDVAREGMELTLKMLLVVFVRHNIERIDPVGETFTPEFHEAMAMVPMPDKEPNSIIEVMEKGYVLNE